ncbi:ATP-binding protein [Thiohalorhabdus sp.]|uniref:ATP-binding protein n=1 Tax=Thiohalorhabdus sp. TaxID=3094134 RepID=UPI002FC2B2A9
MVITRLAADNFLKFRRLELDGLPSQGLIGVTGPNESGKSSIGEALCFGLFGRTFALGPEAPDKLLHWEERQCQVTLDFEGGDGRSYRVSRTLDADGGQGASLTLLEDPGVSLAKGVDQVGNAIPGICGFSFDEFLESFYFAQRDLVHAHPRSEAVQSMAGVTPLVAAEKDLEKATETQKAQQSRVRGDLEETRERLDELQVEEGTLDRLQGLEKDRQTLAYDIDEAANAMDGADEWYRRKRQAYDQARRLRLFLGPTAAVILLAGAAAGAGWALLTYWPDHPYADRLLLELEAIPQWGHFESYLPWLGPGIAALGVVIGIAGNAFARRSRRLKRAASTLGKRVVRAREKLIPDAESLSHRLDEFIAATALDEHTRPQEPAEADPETSISSAQDEPSEEEAVETTPGADLLYRLPGDLAYLGNRITDFRADPVRVGETVSALHDVLVRAQNELEGHRQHLEQRIEDERGRRAEADRLQVAIESSEGELAAIERELAVKNLAGELLTETARKLSNQFNQEVRELTKKALPVLTDGRYQQLRLGEGLEAEVFSPEKGDFLDFDELSSGTRRQILLALRLALSKELARLSGNQTNFLFLDEPFAFFDRERVVATVNGLPQVAEELSQLWLSAQELPEPATVDREVPCLAQSDQLVQTSPASRTADPVAAASGLATATTEPTQGNQNKDSDKDDEQTGDG